MNFEKLQSFYDFTDCTVLVTGGAGVLGLEIVQTRDTLRRVIHHRQLFVEGQARKQILNSFTNGKIAI